MNSDKVTGTVTEQSEAYGSLLETLRHLGRDIIPAVLQQTGRLCAPFAARVEEQTTIFVGDIPYGADHRHRLDVYAPRDIHQPAPMLLYVHGGGFVGGDKATPGMPYFSNIGAWAVQNGVIGAAATYRLAPQAKWPSGAQDVAAAVECLKQNATKLDGDPTQIIIIGHSAGAVHVAGYITGQHGAAPDAAIAGAVLMSGIYDFERVPMNSNDAAYFGSDTALVREISTLSGLSETGIPCLFTVAEHDPRHFQDQWIYAIEATLRKQGFLPSSLFMAAQNHLSSAFLLGSGHGTSDAVIMETMKSWIIHRRNQIPRPTVTTESFVNAGTAVTRSSSKAH